MSSLSAPSAAIAAAPAPAAPVQAAFGLQVVVGLFGVLMQIMRVRGVISWPTASQRKAASVASVTAA